MRISREDLYKEIWSEPATKLAQKYDVSSSYLARVCEGLNVPHPPRGYWARKAAGEKMPVPPLPPAGPGDPVEWVKGVAVMERTPPLAPPPTPKSKPARPVVRPSTHPLVTAWRGFLEEATPTEAGYLVPRKKNVLDAFVTKAAMRAAAETLNAIFIELEMRGHKVQLSADYYGHQRPPVDVAMREIRDRYERRPNDWQPGRPTIAYVRDAEIGLTLFELTEYVRVRRTGADRYVRIKDLPATRRYAPQAPGEEDLTRDMPMGRFVLRAYSPLHDTEWRHEWTETQPGEFAGMAKAIADLLEEAAPVIVQQAKDAEQREKERRIQAAKELRRLKAQQRVEARQRARQEAKKELRDIVEAWNDAFALEAFFTELSRRAAALDGEQRVELEERITAARQLMGGLDAIERFLQWGIPDGVDTDDHVDDVDDEE